MMSASMLPASLLLHAADGAIVTPTTIWHYWGGDGATLPSLVLVAFLYGFGVRRIWDRAGREHVVSMRDVVAFYSGMIVLFLALCSPLDALADTLFSAHMLQHVLLITVAAPLAVLGQPLVPLIWALPHRARIAGARMWNSHGVKRAGGVLVLPVVVWMLHTIALWGWHVPSAYSAALQNDWLHALEHASFYLTSALVWWVGLRPLRDGRGTAAALAVMTGTLFQSGALGALLTFSGTPWYYGQSAGAALWHVTALEDQQLAGLIMWIPAGLFYLAGILVIVHRLFDAPRTSQAPRARVSRRSSGAATTLAAISAVLVLVAATGCKVQRPANQRVLYGDPHRGKVAIEHFGCGSCHMIPGIRSADGIVGPSLAGIADRGMVAGVVQNTPDEMIRWIVMPQSMVPGNAMPNLGVSDGEARDIAAYLYTLH